MAAPTLAPNTPGELPPLPLAQNVENLDVRFKMILALHWMLGGDLALMLQLPNTTEEVASMLLQACSDNDRIKRYMAESAAYAEGIRDGMRRAFAFTNGDPT